MLFTKTVLDRIARGEITVAFRKWRRPTVKTDGRLRTAVGELAIEVVAPVAPVDITDTDAQAAGFAGRAEALAQLAGGEGQLYRIAFRLTRGDRRAVLADSADFGMETASEIRDALRGLDARSRGVAWTSRWLWLVHAYPAVAAATLADMAGVEAALFKRRMQQLKELGLTRSLDVGYRLSPRGDRYLACLEAVEKPTG
jgi:hypothetical protein